MTPADMQRRRDDLLSSLHLKYEVAEISWQPHPTQSRIRITRTVLKLVAERIQCSPSGIHGG